MVDFSFIVSLYVSDLPNVTISTVPYQCEDCTSTSVLVPHHVPKRTKSGQKGYVLPYRCLEVKIHRNKKLKVAKSCLNSYPNGSWGRIEEQ